MRFASSLPKVAALALLAGCTPAAFSPTPLSAEHPAAAAPVHGKAAPAAARRGIYAGVTLSRYSAFGYPQKNRKNDPPICSIGPGGTADLAVDANQNLLTTPGNSNVYVYQGPRMCGNLVAQIQTNAFTLDVASNDAMHGEIVVADIYQGTDFIPGGLEVCTIAAGCTTPLTNSNLSRAFGVALAPNGDCWATGYGYASQAVLIY